MDIAPGVIGTVRVVVTVVDTGAGTCNVRLVDTNGAPITPAATVAIPLVTVIETLVALNDVLEQVPDGLTAVVRWIDPADARRWSPAVSGSPARSTLGWRKVGVCTLS